jgi:DNA repair exonuclease SbcCD ATPase subunit
MEYEKKLKEDIGVSEEHLSRRKRVGAEQIRFALRDFEQDKEMLVEERNNMEELNRQWGELDRRFGELQRSSRENEEEENRKLEELNGRKVTLCRLIEESRGRELFHFEQSKKLVLF